jgi:glutathione S-transferase
MRTVCNILDFSGIGYQDESQFDFFSETGWGEYSAFNPSQSQPMITINKQNVVADPATLIQYLCRTYKLEKVYPMKSDRVETRRRIDALLQLTQAQFKTTTDRLTKLLVQDKARSKHR